MKYLLGLDIGGTKCAVIVGNDSGEIYKRLSFPTDVKRGWRAVMDEFYLTIDSVMTEYPHIEAIGISCGGPLDSKRGIILSPPNLPDWDHVEIVKLLEQRYHIPVRIQNDANACAIAEWKFGAGQGTENMIFLTFGTGMGAGLILNGRLYAGTNDLAGEVGHIRLAPDGPIGYGKAGSFEGFCSGGGVAHLGRMKAQELLAQGIKPAFMPTDNIDDITTKDIALAAQAGDEHAKEILATSGQMLGTALAMFIDILNPQLIVIGSVYARATEFLRPAMEQVIGNESLPLSVKVCRVVPAALGEKIGDIAALTVALGQY